MRRNSGNRVGIALIEVVIYIAVFAMLIGIIGTNLVRARHVVSVSTAIETVLVDLKEQQVKAMSGDTEGRSTHDSYGVYFESDRYTLFHGSSFSPSDTSNFVIELNGDLQLNAIGFPGATIVFSNPSGEISGFVPGSNTLTLRNIQTQDQKTITINKYGVVTTIN